MKKIIKWLKDNLDRDLYEYYGIKKGERNKAIEIAKSLLDVLDIETISIKTGLSIKEIEDIAVMKK